MRSIAIVLSLAAMAIAQPTAPLYVNAGGPSFASSTGTVWRSDASTITWSEWGLATNPTVTLSGSPVTSAVSTTHYISGEGPDAQMWRTARHGSAAYDIEHLPTGTYRYTFYFAEFPAADGGATMADQRRQQVAIQVRTAGGAYAGYSPILAYYDAYARNGPTAVSTQNQYGGAEGTAAFCESSGKMGLQFSGTTGYPSRVNGFKIEYLGSYGCSGTAISGGTPYEITSPGNYYLTEDTTGTDQDVIKISANNVRLDCRGRAVALFYTPPSPRPMIGRVAPINMQYSNGSTITNCNVVYYLTTPGPNNNAEDPGIGMWGARNSTIVNTMVLYSAITTSYVGETANGDLSDESSGISVINSVVSGGVIILAKGSNHTVRGNSVRNTINGGAVSPIQTCTGFGAYGQYPTPPGCHWITSAIQLAGSGSHTVINNYVNGSQDNTNSTWFTETGIQLGGQLTHSGVVVANNVINHVFMAGLELATPQKNPLIQNNYFLNCGLGGLVYAWNASVSGLRFIGNYAYAPQNNSFSQYSYLIGMSFDIGIPPPYENNLIIGNTWVPYGYSSVDDLRAMHIDINPAPDQSTCSYVTCPYMVLRDNNFATYPNPDNVFQKVWINIPVEDHGGNHCYGSADYGGPQVMPWYPVGMVKCGPSVSVWTNTPLTLRVNTGNVIGFLAAGGDTQLNNYNFSYSGDLPPGMTFSAGPTNLFTLSGTPTTAGSYTFTVTAAVREDTTKTGSAEFTITVQ